MEQALTIELLEQLRSSWDVIPVVRELSADTITPVSAFAAIEDPSVDSFLLESVERGESLGRYSFIGFAPRKTLAIDDATPDPVTLLREELVPLRVWNEASLPPFFGGAVGWFGYGVARWTEAIPDRHPRAGAPDARLLFIDNVIAFDHVKQRLIIVANLFAADRRDSAELLTDANQRLDETVARLARASSDLRDGNHASALIAESASCSRETFVAMVASAKEQIAAGEVFQIVLSQSWSIDYPESEALELYRALRAVNPSPYMFLLRTRDCTLVGASPEMLVRVHGRDVETRPIAGTRRRGATRAEDVALEAELLADPKERAEHLMLVDLGRNDLGRVSATGTVRVEGFCRVERYSHVMHLVTDVRGELREGLTPIDAFLACFPAGTVSGAPKIRAMELIDELEVARRGPYAGAVTYVGFSGNLDSCIAIRTISLRDGKATVQAGAGIVYDSVPETEYEETVNKAAALKKAVAVALARIASRERQEVAAS
ncbi:MAG: anthranilate synthase component I [Acidobacteria bacterium]|nr:anthranilate synthase component I [Acidobacteriota bacterium]